MAAPATPPAPPLDVARALLRALLDPPTALDERKARAAARRFLAGLP